MEATRPRMDAKMSGQTMSATITASTITTHDVIRGRFWFSTCFQQKEMVSFAEAVGNSESSATRGFLFERWPGARGVLHPLVVTPGLRIWNARAGHHRCLGVREDPGPAQPVERIDLNLLPGGGLAGQRVD